jgi:putative flippase GtrA
MGMATANVSFLTLLFVLFSIKHVLADFVLQTRWMWQTKDQKRRWAAALAAHAGCHAAFTLALALAISPVLWWLGVVDFALHATIDRARAVAGRRLGLVPDRSGWWWLFGTDQAPHQLTHFAFAIVLATA